VVLTQDYKDHVEAYSKLVAGLTDADDIAFYKASDELSSNDPVYSHWYDRRPMPEGVDDQFIETMML
jgi:hypothetical protein